MNQLCHSCLGSLDEVARLQKENAFLRNGLRDIANPIAMLQREAEANGMSIDWIAAVQFSYSGQEMQEMAKRLLETKL